MSATAFHASDDAALLRRARQRAGARMGFRIHLLVFLAVNLVLAAIALSRGQSWFIWPLLGWGVGLAAHGLGLAWALGSGYRRLVDQELARLRSQAGR
ncbi:2TM domain-containing protein [Ralstonia pseudosolanacearum]|uniref:2TM domain-containing protein n=1 Tax=Ralstonia pseudosolanacearum TaxID=1310165 RepID=UPI000B92F7C3|nr:2TM domain-containing protein [Ralstonia pseudosolanacearum]MCD9229030.1 2TM domain-containing protein [Ralstonia pseudosolanacearum]